MASKWTQNRYGAFEKDAHGRYLYVRTSSRGMWIWLVADAEAREEPISSGFETTMAKAMMRANAMAKEYAA